MRRMELMKLYEFIYLAYNFKDKPLPQDIEMLYPLFEKYSYDEMLSAVKEYSVKALSPPKPAHLLRLADENRSRQRLQSQINKTVRYDSLGRQLFDCPFCQDSGYMLLDLNDIYGLSAFKCICRDPSKKARLLDQGKVTLKLKYKGRCLVDDFAFDSQRGIFIPLSSMAPDSNQVDSNLVDSNLVDPPDLPSLFDSFAKDCQLKY